MNRLQWWLGAAALAAAGCAPAPRRAVLVDATLAALVPADSVMLAGLRMEALRATPVWQKWVAGKPSAPLDELAKETGLELRKDVSEVLLASNGKDAVALARGRFVRAELETAVERRGGQRLPYKGLTIVGTDEGAVTLLDSSTAAAGRPATLRRVIDQRGRSGGAPKALLEEAKAIAAESQVWVVSLGGFEQTGKMLPMPGEMANLTRLAALIEKSTFGADLRAGLSASSTVLCKTEQDARTLSDTLRGVIGLARLTTPDKEPDLLRLYDGIQVTLEQRTVHVRAQIPQDLLDKALAKFSEAGPGAFSPEFRLPRLR